MEYRNLGRSGLKVPIVGVGCINFGGKSDQAESQAVVNKALDLGVTFFDTANVYGSQGMSEEYLGKALGSQRKDVMIATKFSGPMSDNPYDRGGSRHNIMRAVEASLKRLNTDYIDLYQMHGPDQATPIDETLRALDDLVRQGKVRYIGSSNYAGWLLVNAQWTAHTNNLTPFASAQNRYSVLNRTLEKELVPAAEQHGVGILPFFPLESGMLTGKYERGQTPPTGSRMAFGIWETRASAFLNDRHFDMVDQLTPLCEKHGHSLLDLAMGWLAAKPYISCIIAGVTTPEQLEQNVAAAAWRPSPEEAEAIDEITKPE